MPDLRSEYLQGTLDVLVLKTLTWGPRHGYAIGKRLSETTDGLLQALRAHGARSPQTGQRSQ